MSCDPYNFWHTIERMSKEHVDVTAWSFIGAQCAI